MSSSTKPTKQGRKFPGGHYWSGGADIDMKGANLKREKKALVVSTNSVIQCLHMHHHLMIMSNFIHTHTQSIVCEQSEEKKKKSESACQQQVLLSNMHSATRKGTCHFQIQSSLGSKFNKIKFKSSPPKWTHREVRGVMWSALHTDALVCSTLAAVLLHRWHAKKQSQLSFHYVLYNPQLV